MLCFFLLNSNVALFASVLTPEPPVSECDISGPESVVEGTTTTYAINSDELEDGFSFFWSTTGVLLIVGTDSESSVTVKALAPGSGTLCLTRFKAGKEPCCFCTEISVTENPDAGNSPNCAITGPEQLTQGMVDTFTVNAPDDGYRFFWSASGGISIEGTNTAAAVGVKGNSISGGTLCVTRYRAGEAPCCNCEEVPVVSPPCIPATALSVAQVEVTGNGCPGDQITFGLTIQPSNVTPGTILWRAGKKYH